jgi:hypothetical protein
MWIEERLFSPFDEFLATADYRRFLCLLYGFQAPLEAELARTEAFRPSFSPSVVARVTSRTTSSRSV